MKKVKIADDWYSLLEDEFEKPYFSELTDFVRHEYSTTKIFPEGKNIFRAFDSCPLDKLKVVILGQDPYHGDNQANGLCFSVQKGERFPPSLQNIFKEVAACGYTEKPTDGDLVRWA
ncbi:MAG: uracil-DNA glycosylase, partial [Mucinivorans sp.]